MTNKKYYVSLLDETSFKNEQNIHRGCDVAVKKNASSPADS